MKHIPLFPTILFFFFAVFHFPATADDDPFRGPWHNENTIAHQDTKVRLSLQEQAGSTSILQTLGIKGIKFFQTVISPIDGDRCMMHPSCSSYSLQAIKKHGFIVGLIMTTARLTHEKGEMALSPRIWVQDSYRYYDPVENNDFWFLQWRR